MPTPTGLPKAGEVWELDIPLPGRKPMPKRVVVLERSRGDYWSLRVAIPQATGGVFRRDIWTDPVWWLKQGWLKYVGPAGPKTRKALGLS